MQVFFLTKSPGLRFGNIRNLTILLTSFVVLVSCVAFGQDSLVRGFVLQEGLRSQEFQFAQNFVSNDEIGFRSIPQSGSLSHFDTILKPFVDYSICRTGFMNGSDTIYDADYEQLSKVTIPGQPAQQVNMSQMAWGDIHHRNEVYSAPNAWILSKEGHYGCLLEFTGKWLIPCKYDTLIFRNQYLIAKQKGKFGIITTTDSIILPFEFDQIYPDGFLQFGEARYNYSTGKSELLDVVKRGLRGKCTSDGMLVIQPVYELIHEINQRGSANDTYYLVQQKKLKGLLAQTGEVILNPQYQSIELLEDSGRWYASSCLFRVQDTLGRYAVFNKVGEQVTPFKVGQLNPVYTLSSVHEQRCVSFVERTDSLNHRQFVSLITGKESDWYQGMNMIGSEILAYSFNENGEPADWKILDSNFNEIYRPKNSRDQLYGFNYNRLERAANCSANHGESETTVLGRPLHNLGFNSTIFAIQRTRLFDKRELKKNNAETSRQSWSLLNLTTREQSAFAYEDIWRIGSGKEIYYWAVHSRSPLFEGDEYSIDVYDSAMVLQRTICVDKQGWKNKDHYSNVMIIRNDGYLSGVIRMNGETVIPYKIQGELSVLNDTGDSSQTYLSNEKSKYQVLDYKGDPLLGGQTYDRFSQMTGNDFYMGILKNQSTFLSLNMDVLLDSCSFTFQVIHPDEKLYERSQGLQCAIRNGYIYVYENGKFHLATSSFFSKTDTLYKLAGGVFVDQHGKYIQPVTSTQSPQVQCGSLFLEKVSDSLKIMNAQKELIQIIPNVDSYQYNRHGIPQIQVSIKGSKMGIISDVSGRWLLKPEYSHVEMVSPKCVDRFWVQDYRTPKLKWFIVDSTGKSVTEPIFDSKFGISNEGGFYEFRSDYKTGFVNSRFEIVIPAIYTRKVQIHQKTVYVSGNESYLFDEPNGTMFQLKHDLVNENYPKGHLFLFNDSLLILGWHGEEILSAMPLSEVVSSINLSDYLYGTVDPNRTFPFIANNQVYGVAEDSALRILNNNYLIERAKKQVIRLVQFPSSYDIPRVNNGCSVEPFRISNSFFTERIMGDCYVHPPAGLGQQHYSYRNYRIDSSILKLIELKDLFLGDYEPLLDELIAAAIQKKQIYGASCADMPRAISEFKRNFYVRGNSIVFLNYAINKEIEIDLNLLTANLIDSKLAR